MNANKIYKENRKDNYVFIIHDDAILHTDEISNEAVVYTPYRTAERIHVMPAQMFYELYTLVDDPLSIPSLPKKR